MGAGFLLNFLFAIAIFMRFYKLDLPKYICWDETHFGKMAGYYINQTYFVDVHPPFGKLFIAFVGWLNNYDGQFSFEEAGIPYTNSPAVPYVAMRKGCACFGVLTILFVRLAVYNTVKSNIATVFVSVFLIFDYGMIILTRFILLDPLLLCFIFGSLFCMSNTFLDQKCVCNIDFQNSHSFCYVSLKQWLYFIATGIFLGLAISVKFVGFFILLVAWIWSAAQLWQLLRFLPSVGIAYVMQHMIACFVGLITIPVLIYLATFLIHFSILTNTGPGVFFHSSLIQTTFKGSFLFNEKSKNVSLGSTIAIRNRNIEGMYLHSHENLYSGRLHVNGNKNMLQVAGYAFRDSKNFWGIYVAHGSKLLQTRNSLLHNGDIVKLQHLQSRKHLCLVRKNQWVNAAVTKWNKMVCVGDSDIANNWKIEISDTNKQSPIQTLSSSFKLYNLDAGCYLCSTNIALPGWGKYQSEVVCSSSRKESCNWYIEPYKVEDKFTQDDFSSRIGFFSKLLEVHKIMFHLNSQLQSRNGDGSSKPCWWVLNQVPKLFSKPEDALYLTGNSIIWFVNILTILAYVVVCLVNSIRYERHEKMFLLQQSYSKLRACHLWFVGWFTHYLPFFFMNRALFFHHYFPAHIFACMLSASLLDMFICEFSCYISIYFLSNFI